jgi:Matrixin
MFRRSLVFTLTAAFLAALPAAATAAQQRTASATGVANVQGKNVFVEVFVVVPQGQSARQATNAALAQQGAQPQPPPGPGGPGFTGLVWDDSHVEQSYNPGGEPAPAESLLTATQASWSAVPGSDFAMSFGGVTSRCPSIVRECPGRQLLDGYNDVGWARLSGGTLGVTWSTTGGADEADMALSTRVPWSTGCADVAGSFDLQTVLLHENGHVAGLDHASSTASVMYPFYQGARCSLSTLDQQAISALYPRG